MHPYTFRAPSPSHGLTALWDQTVTPDMQGHDVLFKLYWERFNTFKIPILHYTHFQSKATNLAKRAKSQEDFERLFQEENDKELRKLLDFIERCYPETIRNNQTFSCRDARSAATGACYGTLEAFVHLLKGTVFGWEADEVRRVTIDTNAPQTREDSTCTNLNSCQNCKSIQLLSCRTCKQKLDYCSNCGPQLDSCECCSAIRPGDIDTDLLQYADPLSYKRDLKPTSNRTTTNKDKFKEAKSLSMQTTLGKRKRAQSSDQGPEWETSAFTSHEHTQETATATLGNSYQSPANKRQKLQRAAGLKPTSTNRSSLPSPVTYQRASRKRPREKDDLHKDNVKNDNHRQKRRKSEDQTAYTATFSASSS
ncbi:hypothetical protein V8C35DRAFT_297923, partial [Trichoderma chlorosporum]